MRFNQKTKTLIRKAKVARLATVDQKSNPYVIPVVFVFHKNSFFIPLDEKTKSVNPKKMKRVKNIEKNPNVCLLIDQYQNNWKKLFFLMIHGTATIIDDKKGKILSEVHKLLISKYSQYKKTGIGNFCIKINPKRITHWQYSN
ncbi:MAG: pyridoxamine 5'-phosphate oxidase family protein [Thaumarchaeota archaeon]|nr:pyridoxamine 5'-phosphate oxidase family protein [Nitrososphaerota archaeon]